MKAVESFKHHQKSEEIYSSNNTVRHSHDTSLTENVPESGGLVTDTSNENEILEDEHPKFEILPTRKFELTELCEVFFNRWVKYFYLTMLVPYCFLVGWSLATMAGAAWSTNIPFSSNTLKRCEPDAFLHHLIPTESSCVSSYRLCLLFFAVIVITLALMDLKEQAIIQMVLGVLRFTTIIAMVLYSIVKLIEGGNPCSGSDQHQNETVNLTGWLGSGSASASGDESISGGSSFNKINDLVLKFDNKGWFVAIPVFTYAYFIREGIPSLTHPIKQKHHLRWVMVCVYIYGVSTGSFLVLGVAVSFYFRESIQETATLNWVELSRPHHSPQLRALSYFVVLFPSLDVCSAYPLLVHAVANNIYCGFIGENSFKQVKHRFGRLDSLIQLAFRFVVAILPIVAALFLSNLVYVVNYAGLMGFAICFFFPAALQLQSQCVCKKVFSRLYVKRQNEHKNGSEGALSLQEKPSHLLVQDKGHSRALYMTPYSSKLLSHPLCVSAIGVLEVVFFILTVVGLFMRPKDYTCENQ